MNIGIAITRVTNGNNSISSHNQLGNDSSIAVRDGATVLANCVTGLGPNGSNSNSVLGGWFFNGNQLSNQVCSDGVTVLDSEYAGVSQLRQCGLPTEGVYTCIIINSAMMQQVMNLTLYYNSRSKCSTII